MGTKSVTMKPQGGDGWAASSKPLNFTLSMITLACFMLHRFYYTTYTQDICELF